MEFQNGKFLGIANHWHHQSFLGVGSDAQMHHAMLDDLLILVVDGRVQAIEARLILARKHAAHGTGHQPGLHEVIRRPIDVDVRFNAASSEDLPAAIGMPDVRMRSGLVLLRCVQVIVKR